MPPNRSLSHTKQRGPHSLRIPTRGYILQQGKNGMLGIHWGSAQKDTSSAEGLISSVYVFSPSLSSLSSSFNPSLPPAPLPALLIPPIGILRLDLKLWYNIYCVVKPSEENVAMQLSRRVFQWLTDWKYSTTCINSQTKKTTSECCSHGTLLQNIWFCVCECGFVCVLRALDHVLSRKGWVSWQCERVAVKEWKGGRGRVEEEKGEG